MNIASACDDAFAPHLATMLHSAHLYHPDADYWVLAYGLSAEKRQRLADFAAAKHLALTILEGFEARLENLHLRQGQHVASYARLLLADLLPASVNRVLYIDADATITGNLAPLFDLDLEGCPAAAVPDGDPPASSESAALGLPKDAVYCNSGILLLDLSAWRKEELGGAILAYARQNPDRGMLMDQSALNAVLARRLHLLPSRWNFFDPRNWRAAAPPAIIHYAGLKPWSRADSHFRSLYFLHRDQTPWPAPRRPVFNKAFVRQLRHRLGGFLGVRRYQLSFEIWRAVTRPALADARRLMAKNKAAFRRASRPKRRPRLSEASIAEPRRPSPPSS